MKVSVTFGKAHFCKKIKNRSEATFGVESKQIRSKKPKKANRIRKNISIPSPDLNCNNFMKYDTRILNDYPRSTIDVLMLNKHQVS